MGLTMSNPRGGIPHFLFLLQKFWYNYKILLIAFSYRKNINNKIFLLHRISLILICCNNNYMPKNIFRRRNYPAYLSNILLRVLVMTFCMTFEVFLGEQQNSYLFERVWGGES